MKKGIFALIVLFSFQAFAGNDTMAGGKINEAIVKDIKEYKKDIEIVFSLEKGACNGFTLFLKKESFMGELGIFPNKNKDRKKAMSAIQNSLNQQKPIKILAKYNLGELKRCMYHSNYIRYYNINGSDSIEFNH